MIEEHYGKIITGIVGFFSTGALWLIRIIVGNNKRITVLEANEVNRDKKREEDREMQQEMRGDIKSILEKL